ncbi:helix-turn-helix domain-containing protein [Staphylococcus equorum]|uniref:helix-turn-helix domain-containing protein n=1 Tax=Staphylococcus equorum TaxID=246432 RepID=UPI003CF9E6B8
MSNQILNIVPTRDNTVISDEQVVKQEALFARPNQIAKIYAISPSTVQTYIKEIEANKDFAYLVKRPGPGIVILEIKGFESFLEFRQKKSFQKISK